MHLGGGVGRLQERHPRIALIVVLLAIPAILSLGGLLTSSGPDVADQLGPTGALPAWWLLGLLVTLVPLALVEYLYRPKG